jgi:uncharacterized protein (DUF58 family)
MERGTGDPLLDPVLLNAIGDLELVARVTVDGTVSGLHRSPFHGFSAEFQQYRHYRPGDDLKYVDWKLLARTDRVYTKQYRETTNLVAQIAVDASASMAYRGERGVSKIDYARMLAAALAHIAAGQGDAVGLSVFADALRAYVPGRSGQAHLRRVLLALTSMEAGGATAAAAALKRATDFLKRRGLLIVVSDLYDEDGGVEEELRRALRIGHEVAVFHVLTSDEVEFPFTDGYRREFAAFLDRWRGRCAASGIDYTLVTTDAPLDRALRGYLIRRAGGPAR